jgi:hypothetical protein
LVSVHPHAFVFRRYTAFRVTSTSDKVQGSGGNLYSVSEGVDHILKVAICAPHGCIELVFFVESVYTSVTIK